ncbi:ATP-binding protein [Paracidovorax konjaci]|uniref:Histidine kinase-, DNA gyrase B-, and HSP90-like ATPase n=1 Tax=Paracidovorax konjaci TaxID=32040 RepID=A0A1I1X0W9_9BURK|nr:ATP-binding protein [Paracidovorax konjaci]SFE00891.1 Histidine kinase-, DNA gyrase B-, and HSP90-like ATPase [Paracidovorax konjaci]
MNAKTQKIDIEIPMIQTGQALLSLRDSGHSLPTALGEVIDNSIEASANNIAVLLEQSEERGKKRVHRIAISDDGAGMPAAILHRYLVLGYSSRYMRSDTIGKYGVGAKLAALNFGRRIDVWSRDTAGADWLHVHFDLDEALKEEAAGKSVVLSAPAPAEPPADLKLEFPNETGTVVLWSRVDRLEEGRAARDFNELRQELEKELSRIFRHFLDGGIKISINGQGLVPHDPLMLLERTWADVQLNKEYKRDDLKRGALHHYRATTIGEDLVKVGEHTARLRVTLYPKEVLRSRGKGGDALARTLRVPENEGALSFVRKNREVAYSNVPRILPGGVKDTDRFIGIEVSFDPELDDYFGIRNVKRGVEPHGELREKLRELLKKHIPTARKLIDDVWGEASRQQHEASGEHGAILDAVKGVDATMPKPRAEPQPGTPGPEDALKELAEDAGFTKPEEQQKYVEDKRKLPFVIESVSFPGNVFLSTTHVADQVIIRLNTRHPFYREMWEPLKAISQRDPGTVSGDEAVKAARRSIEAMSLLLVAYGKAESMHPNPVDQYQDLTQFWGQFLGTLLNKVKDVL